MATTSLAHASSPSSPDRHDLGISLLIAAAGLVAGLFAASANAATTTAAVPLEDHLARAHDLVARGEPGRAVFHLRRHLEDHPDDADARSLLAGAYARLGLSQSALGETHLVLAAQPRHAGALRTLAELQVAAGHATDAIDTIASLRVQGEGDPQIDLLEARALFKAGRHAEAAPGLRAAIERAPLDAELLALFALNALRAGRVEAAREAVDALARAVELRPDSAALRNSLGFAHEKLGDLERAHLAYSEAEGLSGDARYAKNRGRVEAALARR
jgi:Flp pilus assembly protein TadD